MRHFVSKALREWRIYRAISGQPVVRRLMEGMRQEWLCDGRCLYGRAFGQGFDSPQVHTCKTAGNVMFQRFLNMMSQKWGESFSLSPFIIYSAFNNIGLSFFCNWFSNGTMFIYSAWFFDICPDGINVIRWISAIPQAALPSVSRGAGAIRLGRPCLSRSHGASCPVCDCQKEYNSGYVYFFPILLIQHLHKCLRFL